MTSILSFFNDLPFAGLMLAVSLGYTLGRMTWRGLSLGPAGGTVFIALSLGYLGVELAVPGEHESISIGRFGLCLFIYSVGFEVGPRVISCLKGSLGWRFALLGGLVNVLAVATTLVCARWFEFDASTAAGVLSGAITSAATFAAASERAHDPALLSIGFAVTYPFGLVGLVLLIQTLPRLLRQPISGGDDEVALDTGRLRPAAGLTPEVTRAYRVDHPGVAGQPLRDLALTRRTGCYITRLHRGDQVLAVDADSHLEVGDHVLATGRIDELETFEGLVGPEVYVEELYRRVPQPRRIHVTRRQVADQTLADLRIMERYRCLIQSVERGGELLEPSADLALIRGDVVRTIGPRDRVRALSAELGGFEPAEHVTDIALYSGGILIGLLLSRFHLRPLGLDLSLGLAGGLLFAGILLSYLQRFRPLRTHVPESARQLVRDLGILLFVGETGLRAGGALAEQLQVPWSDMIVAGACVTVLPALVAVLVGGRLLSLRPIETWGSVSGGMTSSAALHAVRQAADSNEPAISYAAAYAVGSVLATVAGQVVMRVV